PSPEVQERLAEALDNFESRLAAKDAARLEEFLASLRPSVELAKESIPKLQHYVSTIELLLQTPLPVTVKDTVRPFHRRAIQKIGELQNVISLFDEISPATTYEQRQSAIDFITKRTSGTAE